MFDFRKRSVCVLFINSLKGHKYAKLRRSKEKQKLSFMYESETFKNDVYFVNRVENRRRRINAVKFII